MTLTEAQAQQQQRALDAALASYEQDRAKLLGPDGTPLYVDGVHQEKETELLARLDRAVSAAQALADQEVQEVAALELALDADPLERLSAEELARASTLREFVAEDARLLPAEEIERRLQRYEAAGDRVRLVLFHRYLTQRLDALRQAGIPEQRAARVQLEGLLNDLSGKLADPKRADAKRALFDRVALTRTLRQHAGAVHAKAHRTQEKLVAELRASGRYSL